MAPKKGTKREAAAAVPAAKKSKVDPAVAGVMEAIDQAVDLSESCRKMLQAGVALGLGTPQDQRHEVQNSVVAMIAETIEGVRAKLQQGVDAENAKLGQVDAHRSQLQAAVSTAEESLVAAKKEADEKAEALTKAAEETLAAKALLQEKLDAQKSGDAAFVEAKENKDALEKAIAENLQVIIEGTSDELAKHYEALLPLLQGKGFDESLMSAMPSVCSKPAADRGQFDSMVLEQLGQSLRERVDSLAKLIEEGLPASQERQTAVDEAQSKVEACAKEEEAATEAASDANVMRQTADAALKAAKSELAGFEPEYKEASSARDEQLKKLGDFKDFNMHGFEQLRNKVSAAARDAPSGGA